MTGKTAYPEVAVLSRSSRAALLSKSPSLPLVGRVCGERSDLQGQNPGFRLCTWPASCRITASPTCR